MYRRSEVHAAAPFQNPRAVGAAHRISQVGSDLPIPSSLAGVRLSGLSRSFATNLYRQFL